MQFNQLNRREFATLVGGGAAASWPLAARAQQTGRVWRVAVIGAVSPLPAMFSAFREALRQRDWTEGKNAPVHHRLRLLPDADRRLLPSGRTRDLAVPAQGTSAHARVSDHARSFRRSRWRAGPYRLPRKAPCRTRDTLSRLNGWPMHSPTDASPTPSRAPAHGSGPMWIATPSS
jgi:hypothetical protein